MASWYKTRLNQYHYYLFKARLSLKKTFEQIRHPDVKLYDRSYDEYLSDKLCEKFNFPSSVWVWGRDEKSEAKAWAQFDKKMAEVPELKDLAALVKSGKYIVEADEHTEQHERANWADSHLLVTIKPSESYAPTAPIKALEVRFGTGGGPDVTNIDLRVTTAKETFAFNFSNEYSLPGVLKDIARLGHEKLHRDGSWEAHLKTHGDQFAVRSRHFKAPQP
jgi:hypothetical protein